jgi:DHA1 family multidrug resistance protein-like MFS transporter
MAGDRRGRPLWSVGAGTAVDTRQRAFVAIAFLGFFDTFALLPVLPVYARELGAQPWAIGLTVGLYSLLSMVAQVGSGAVVDGFGGRRGSLLWSLLGAAVLLPLYGVAERVETLLLVRSMHGLTGALFIPALFAAAGEYAGIERARMMGRLGAAIAVVAIVAPPIGGALYRIGGATLCFVGLGGIMAVAALIAWRYVPETVRSSGASLPRPWQVLRVRSLVGVYLLTLGFTLCAGILAYRFPLRVGEWGGTTATAGVLLGWMALVAAVVMVLLHGRLQLRMFGGLPLVGGALAALEGVVGVVPSALVLGLYGIGFGALFPALHLQTFEWAPAELRGSAFALLYVFYSGGIVLGPLLAAALQPVLPPGVVGLGCALVLTGCAAGVLRRCGQWR